MKKLITRTLLVGVILLIVVVVGSILFIGTKAVAANVGKLPDAGKSLGTGVVDQLKKGGSGIGELFKKK